MKPYRFLTLITALFVTCLIISNIIAVKLAAFGPWFLPAAVIIFPLSYIFGDVLTEVYGYARARQVIWLGFGCNLVAVLAIAIGGAPPSPGVLHGGGSHPNENRQTPPHPPPFVFSLLGRGVFHIHFVARVRV